MMSVLLICILLLSASAGEVVFDHTHPSYPPDIIFSDEHDRLFDPKIDNLKVGGICFYLACLHSPLLAVSVRVESNRHHMLVSANRRTAVRIPRASSFSSFLSPTTTL